jgi:hypothetical protein
MASHPYISAAGAILQSVDRFRSRLPSDIDSATIQKLGLAPNNESYLINIFKFIGIADDAGKPTSEAREIFSLHDDKEFKEAFSKLIARAYHALYDLHGEKMWNLNSGDLVTFFRKSDQSSDVVGQRQAKTFETLAAIAGKREALVSEPPANTKPNNRRNHALRSAERRTTRNNKPPKDDIVQANIIAVPSLGLTVRIELNPPADATRETYDDIFKSIRENLVNGRS